MVLQPPTAAAGKKNIDRGALHQPGDQIQGMVSRTGPFVIAVQM
jgi:hypothetical protein